jgi:CHAT domain-containing protein/Tfp pilus assembly protein PilF
MRNFSILFFLLFGFTQGAVSFTFPDAGRDDYLNDSARILNNMGINSHRLGDFEQAARLFKRSLEIKKKEHGSLSLDMATTFSNLGVVNRRLNRNSDAMAYYDTAGYIFINYNGPDHALLGAVYQNQGNILREQRDINSALSYYNQALRIFVKSNEIDWVAGLYNNMGIAYKMAEHYEKAKECYYMAIELRKKTDPAGIALPAGNLAIYYKEAGKIKEADKYYKMALDAIEGNWGRDHVFYAINLMNYGLFLVADAGEPGRGYEMLLRALEIHKSNFGNKGHHVARTLMNIGLYHFEAGSYNQALDHFQRSIVANSATFNSLNKRENPPPSEEVFSMDYMLESLKHKAYSLYLISDEYDARAEIESSLETYKLAMEFIERIRMGHNTEESQLILSENEHETYMQAIHVAWKLYELTKEEAFLEEAFRFSERSKASSLLASLRNVEARSFGGVPEELLEMEQSLKRGIAAHRELVYEEQKNIEADNVKITFWQERIFSLDQELRQLIARLELEYPDYYALKYNHDIVSVRNIKDRINSRDVLLSYVYNDSLVYIFTITKDGADFRCIKTGGSTVQQIENLLEVLTSGNLDRRVRDDYMTFTASSRFLYNLLIEPVLSVIKGKRLIIVPDGLLSYIPFELLLSSDPEPGGYSYKNLQYLLRDFIVSYNYSATLWQKSLVKKSRVSGNILAMAPSYEFAELPSQEMHNTRHYYRDKLVPLPGARDEAVRIAEMMNGEVLLDKNATEYNFKQRSGDYYLLHLAMHTLLDDENPMFSKLVFTEPDDDREDGFLNTYEIYNLRLNASMAVLSSCRSGYGTLRRGEGVMSLARGFLYAGVPSIVMTNWEIEDKSGAVIMIDFYKYLLKGYRKDAALRQARLDFIENTDMLKAHPYFWGAYVCIGNTDELFKIHRKFYPVATFIVLLLVMLIILWHGNAKGGSWKHRTSSERAFF